jgi:hypothetical protein
MREIGGRGQGPMASYNPSPKPSSNLHKFFNEYSRGTRRRRPRLPRPHFRGLGGESEGRAGESCSWRLSYCNLTESAVLKPAC